jgi:peptidyl-prolyl cis-trans isomerase SurA
MQKYILTILLSLLFTSALVASTGEEAPEEFEQSRELVSDRIIAIVNDRIILKSDVDREIAEYMQQMRMSNQQIQFDTSLWYEVLESIIDNYMLLEKARIDSINVPDEMVDRQMDQRIRQLVQQAGSEQALEQAMGQSIVEIRAEHREMFREQMVAQQVREKIVRDVSITRPEVIEFFESIPRDSLPMIPEQVALSQIVKIPPPLQDAQEAARDKAVQIRDSIVNHGKSFEEMARQYSTGPAARNGGLLPMMPIGDLVSEYSAAAAALEPGEVSGVVRTSFGFHIIRLNRRVGDEIETNNLLITIDEAGLDEEAARNELEAIRDSILHHGKSFSEMARKHSDDEFTRNMGGRILNRQTGERLLALNMLDSGLYRTALLLEEEGDISEPRSFNPDRDDKDRAFRIVRLDRHVPEHRANLDQDFERIRNIALQQKQMEKLAKTLERMRDQVYIEYKIDVPERYREPQPQYHDIEFEPETPVDTQ